MVRFSLITLVLVVHIVHGESFTLKRSARRNTIASLQEQLCTECAAIMEHSPTCIKKIVVTKNDDSTKLLLSIADIQQTAITIIQTWFGGTPQALSKEQLEQAVKLAHEADIALQDYLKKQGESGAIRLSNASQTFLNHMSISSKNTA